MEAIQATQAYGAARDLNALMDANDGKIAAQKVQASANTPVSSFGDIVDNAIQRLESKTVATDNTAIGLAKGESNIVDVVTAVAETELALETLVSIRDQVISSYQEVLRMPI